MDRPQGRTPSASATTQLVRISLVAIISMLMPASARLRNMRAAVPAVQGMPAPTALTRAMAGPSSKRAPAIAQQRRQGPFRLGQVALDAG